MSDSEIEQSFNKAAEIAKNLKNLSNDQLLLIYKNYKQATVGDINIPKPGMFDFKGGAKWDAWNSVKGTDKLTAMQNYIKTVLELYSSK